MAELKPCPFCGGKAVTRMECESRRTGRPYGTFYTECRSCGASVGFAFVDAEDAEKAWNRRASE